MLISGHTVGQVVSVVEVEKAQDQIRKIEMHINRKRFLGMFLFLIAGLLISCSPKSTPPGANSIGGAVDEARFSYHYWEEGLAILIWHDLSYGGGFCSGTGSTDDPVYRLECDVDSTDGQSFSWKVHTRDGVTADMWIEDESYDLSQGNMFLVSSRDDGIQVDQLHRDFSELEPNDETISDLSNSDPDVADFIARISSESGSPDADIKDGLMAFTDALNLAGQSVDIAGPVDQPFFSVPGQLIIVNGEDVQIFEYPDSVAAEAEAAQISPDASSVGTSMMSWVGTPHFYKEDQFIVLYVGENNSVTKALTDALGEPIAEGQAAELPPQADSTAPNAESEPASPEQQHPLAGLVYRQGHEIWIIDEKGEPVYVFDEPSARLSADGRYALFQPEYDPDIWLADLTTGERRNLTEASNRYNGLAQWWPGQPDTIIFGSSEELGPGFGYPTIVDTDGSDYRVLDQERGGPLALSADGEMLAYGGFDESGRIVRQGSEPEDFYPSDYSLDVEKVFQPAWSPDGRKLAWKVSGDPERHGWTSGVAVFDLENGSAELFHTYTAVGGSSVPHYLSWSPSGDWLAFVTFNERAEDGRRPNLWIAHPDGQGEIRLGVAFETVWSPDGNQIAYSLYDDTLEAYQVWIHDTVTGQQTQILPAGTTAVDWLEPTNELMQTLRQYSITD